MSKEIIFCQTHIDYYTDASENTFTKPVITIFGTKKDGTPIQVLVNNYFPYFYVEPLNSKSYSEDDIETAISRLDYKGQLISVKTVSKQSIYGYSESPKIFYKLTFNIPSIFNQLKTYFESGIVIGKEKVKFRIYESNFPFVLRFMCDLDIIGMSYLKIKDYELVSLKPYVISTEYDSVTCLPLEGDFVGLPPFKILSLDIECIGNGNAFPIAKTDPIIQIGNTITTYGDQKQLNQTIFCLKETASIPGATVRWFNDEKEMLEEWLKYFLESNPDIIIGYNIKGFDIPYILERGEVLGVKNISLLGRTNRKVKIRDNTMSSNAFGSISTTDVEFEGRIIFDIMTVIRRDHKLRSYSLNSVSTHFLNEQKEDVPYSSISGLQNGDKDTRRRIASYCLRDTVLPIRLFNHLDTLVNYTELARVTGVPIDYFMTRGVAVKVLTLIYRAAHRRNYIIPTIDAFDNERTYEGGFVMDPIRGFYDRPISVMDFSSLYPSIMISKNLCYTTLLTEEQYKKVGGIKTPTNNYFCSPETKKGLLPTVLLELLASRKKTRVELANTKDPVLKSCLNGRQLAIKICANSIYGFTGASTGKLPCYEISQSVTSFGREMIGMTKRLIEENYSKEKGYTHNSKVIYGDTDSVMIDFNEYDLKKVFEMSKEISEFVTSKFIKPVALEFEKVYYPYLLINKKRYAGLMYSNANAPSKIDTKGIETVRRDNCELVKEVVETVLEKILYEKDVEAAKNYVKDSVRDLYMGKTDFSKLIISKSLTKTGDKYESKQAHVELAEKLKKREGTTAPALGDRVAYIIVNKGKGKAAYEKSEDPLYALENNLPIDTEYYIEQQLSKPLHRIFEPIMDNVFELFRGEHTTVVNATTPLNGPLNAFLTKTETCIGCKTPGSIICKKCKVDFPLHFSKIQKEVEEKKIRLNECWVECQRCMGSIHNEVLCVNRDCPIFYMRVKVRKELGPLDAKLKKLRDLSW